MDSNFIDKKYDDFLATINEDQIEEVNKVLEDSISEENKLLREIKNGNIPVDDTTSEPKIVKTYIDSCTGLVQHIEEIDTNNVEGSDLDNLINMNEAFTNVDIDNSKAKNILNNTFGDNISDNDMGEFINLIKKYKNKEKINYYTNLPKSFKTIIDSTILFNSDGNPSLSSIQMKNKVAKELLQESLEEIFVENTLDDFDTQIMNIMQETNKDIAEEFSKYENSVKNVIEDDFLKLSNEIKNDNPEKSKLLKKCSENYKESYTYNNMMRCYKETNKLKAKPIDISKFNRVCSEFNFKYKDTKMVINDISSIFKILNRILPNDIEEELIKRFIIAFCKYTKNMKPENIEEHIFMYYFIKNIINFDFYNKYSEDSDNFYNNLKNNIINFIYIIKEKEGL